MRYQERIYIQNQNSAVRNRNFNNYNFSSDMCIFVNPQFNLSGGTKIDCCNDCPETVSPHDTYTGGTITLPTNNTGGDCEDLTTIVGLAREQAKIDYINSGATAVTNHLNIEVIGCTQVVKWRIGLNEVWFLRDKNGNLAGYYIDDYTDTQNTIFKPTIYSIDGPCCGGSYINAQKEWNDFLIATGYTGTTLFVNLPYSASTSCLYERIDCPQFNNITGATYIISSDTQNIPLYFNFTGNTDSFTANNATFKYEIYKFDENTETFLGIPVYKSDTYQYSAFSATNITTQNIPVDSLDLDGEYLVKGYYSFDKCTDFLNRLGKKYDTYNFKYGTKYGLYNEESDYYFMAMFEAEKPSITYNGSNTNPVNKLLQSTLLPESGTTYFAKPFSSDDNFILTLNGLVLARNYDYSVSGDVITLSSSTATDDIITFIYTSIGGQSLVYNTIDVTSTIVSGTTNNQGDNLVYFNTTTGKYEVYLSVTPSEGNDILLMLNGITLANNIDYYQSNTNVKRLILEGNVLVGDIITIFYLPQTDVTNGLNTNFPIISWSIQTAPSKVNGYFSLEVSTANTFNNFYYSGRTDYVVGDIFYSDTFTASGTVGTMLYYRVKNYKNYETICGNKITSITYSETIPLTIISNAINSY